MTWWTRFSTAKRADFEATSYAHKKARYEKNPDKHDDPDAPPKINESKLHLYDNLYLTLLDPNCLVRACGGGGEQAQLTDEEKAELEAAKVT